MTFAVGTDTFILAGLLKEIGSDLHVSTTTAAQLVTIFSITFACCAPILSTLIRPSHALRAGLVIFILGNAFTALAPTFGVALGARVLTAVGASMLTPSASAITAAITPPEQRGRALAFVMNGLMTATALGVPAGLILGNANWRHTVWILAILGLIALIANLLVVPAVDMPPTTRARRVPLHALIVISTTILVVGANMQVFTYAQVITGLTGKWLIACLTAFGVFTVIGNIAAGRLTDSRGPLFTVVTSIVGLMIILLAAPLLPPLLLLSINGFFGGMFTVPQQARIVAINPTLLGLLSSAVYIGFATSSALGKVVIDNIGPYAITWTAATLLIIPLILCYPRWNFGYNRKHQR